MKETTVNNATRTAIKTGAGPIQSVRVSIPVGYVDPKRRNAPVRLPGPVLSARVAIAIGEPSKPPEGPPAK